MWTKHDGQYDGERFFGMLTIQKRNDPSPKQ